MRLVSLFVPLALALPALAFSPACSSSTSSNSTSSSSSSTSSSSGATCATPGGAKMGAADKHCGSMVVKTGACPMGTGGASSSSSSGAGGAAGGAGGAGGGAGGMAPEFGTTMYGSEGDDDDCKYHVTWTSTAICENNDVTFTMTLTSKVDGKPVSGADPYIEAFLTDTHASPNRPSKTNEAMPGVYTIGPVAFDAKGDWTVRFHVFGKCDDAPDSPHGHAAFFVTVP